MKKLKDSGCVISKFKSRKAMIICDKNMLRMGYAHQVISSLYDQSIKYVLFSDVGHIIEEERLDDCAEIASKEDIDSIVAIGNEYTIDFSREFISSSRRDYPVYEVEI